MKNAIESRLEKLSKEINDLIKEKQILHNRMDEIDVRVHQLTGAIYELQSILINPDCQSSDSCCSGCENQSQHQI